MEYNSLPAIILKNYGIYSLLLPKIGIILLLFYMSPKIKSVKYRWSLLKHIIEFIGIVVTINNLMVILVGYSLVQAIGLV